MTTNVDSSGYYPEPYSLHGLPPTVHTGLMAIGSLATLSLISTFSLLVFLAYRFATLRKWNKHAPPVNQCGMLVANLLLADFLQALSLALSFHWLMADAILAPDRYCWAQAALLHLGDLASGFLVLLIAIHAACSVLMGRRMGFRWLVASVGAVWIAAVIITISGPLKFGKPFFTRAGSWCSISPAQNAERLTLHWLWIFIVDFGSIVIFVSLFIYTSLQTRQSGVLTSNSTSMSAQKLNKAAWYMCLYPLLYCVLTLPLAVCHMISIHGGTSSPTAYLIGGALLASSGWCDAFVYTFIGSTILQQDLGPQSGQVSTKSRLPRSPNTFARPGFESTCIAGPGSSSGSGIAMNVPEPRSERTSTRNDIELSTYSSTDRAELGEIYLRTTVDVFHTHAEATQSASAGAEVGRKEWQG